MICASVRAFESSSASRARATSGSSDGVGDGVGEGDALGDGEAPGDGAGRADGEAEGSPEADGVALEEGFGDGDGVTDAVGDAVGDADAVGAGLLEPGGLGGVGDGVGDGPSAFAGNAKYAVSARPSAPAEKNMRRIIDARLHEIADITDARPPTGRARAEARAGRPTIDDVAQWQSFSRRLPNQPIDHAAFVDQQLVNVTRVVAVNRTHEIGPVRLTLLSLELYTDGSVAQFLLVQRRRDDQDRYGVPQFRVTGQDDAETRYADRSHGGSGSSSPLRDISIWRMAHAFSPKVPEAAREFRLRIEAVGWLGRSNDELVETERIEGPWEFVVQL